MSGLAGLQSGIQMAVKLSRGALTVALVDDWTSVEIRLGYCVDRQPPLGGQ